VCASGIPLKWHGCARQGGGNRLCESHGDLEGGKGGGAVKCYYKEDFPVDAAGEYAVRCFVAKDPHGDRFFDQDVLNSDPLPAFHPPVSDGVCDAVKNTGRDCDITRADFSKLTHETQSEGKRLTCRSMPMCFKIKIMGRAPQFVAPTPLEANSVDDSGVPVAGRTDVAVCEGFPLHLWCASRWK